MVTTEATLLANTEEFQAAMDEAKIEQTKERAPDEFTKRFGSGKPLVQHLTDEQKDEVRKIVREEWVFSLMETSSPWTDERKSLYLREMNDRLQGKIR